MSSIVVASTRQTVGFSGWKRDVLLGVVVAAVSLGIHAATGFPTIASGSDNDSMLRLVQVRDLIAGQGWYDLHQYRMGSEGGFVMHWSRIVDVPIAAIVLAVAAVTGSTATGETAALIAWPIILMAAAAVLILRIAKTIGGDSAALPALTIGGAALHFVGIFAPGNIDHHNVQLVLTLVAIAALIAKADLRMGVAAGAASAVSLAVGMETLPYVAVAGLATATAFLFGGRNEASRACGFGLGFACAGALAFLGTVPRSGWFLAQCDAYSIPQFTVALIAGSGLAAACGMAVFGTTFMRRLAALGLIGLAVIAVVTIFFPQCLSSPYANLDQRLQDYWLNSIAETKSIWWIIGRNHVMAATYYVTPLLGLAVLGWHLMRSGIDRRALIVAAFLATSIAISFWQVRGAMFAIPLGAIPLSAWVAERRRIAATGRNGTALMMALAWLLSVNIVWAASADVLAETFAAAPDSPKSPNAIRNCGRAADFATLAAMPPTTVLAISNLGAAILANTRHRVLAGLYHRNIDGNLATLTAFTGSQDEAAAVVRDNHVGLVVLCRDNSETNRLEHSSPTGFLATLAGGNVPSWLEKIPETAGDALEIYRVRVKPES